MKNWQSLVDDLWNGDKAICFFVHYGAYYWVVDDKFNFSLDAEKEFRAYLAKGHINQEQYDSACASFREGLVNLTAENFLIYLNSKGRQVLFKQDLSGLFNYGIVLTHGLHEKVESYYLYGRKLTETDFSLASSAASRLPLFYVNFDRNIYLHMDYGRCHEDLAYEGWYAKYENFNHLIPDGEKYWVLKGSDCWKYRFL